MRHLLSNEICKSLKWSNISSFGFFEQFKEKKKKEKTLLKTQGMTGNRDSD